VNLTAVRGAPRVWLVAHLDSKSQPVPIALRALGITAVAAVWMAAIALAAAQLAGVAPGDAWPWLTGAGVAAALPVIASTVGARSPGALDNASGVASVLVAAESLPRDVSVGVLLTSAEELGLAGARAWVRGRAAGVALNCDGVDDVGTLTCMYSGRAPAPLLAVVRGAAGGAVRVRRLIPGILVDGVALADAGWDVITVSRGTVGTLARIHSAADTDDRLTGTGIASAGDLLARLARALA
jgi:Zn-dependent M28 family amino/carboxypeptidase